ncbi:hypothetical protein CEXT_760351 [Caerostris extrusa]|uniref:Uncharacterized protein n=1 Tax=Caerostris extrusa TaxID=172846 RepID=A0AAV4TD75_CAEEX|nr:hypothetical protein CEXT_760351 [Caerostris extrusa]
MPGKFKLKTGLTFGHSSTSSWYRIDKDRCTRYISSYDFTTQVFPRASKPLKIKKHPRDAPLASRKRKQKTRNLPFPLLCDNNTADSGAGFSDYKQRIKGEEEALLHNGVTTEKGVRKRFSDPFECFFCGTVFGPLGPLQGYGALR